MTGKPTPTVTWSKDDSNGSWGSKKVQINLTRSEPSYTLTAKAKNSAGEATDSISLDWGCGPLVVEETDDFHPSAIGSVSAGGTVNTVEMFIGDNFADQDVRGFFAFDVDSLDGKEIISAEIELDDPDIPEDCDFKGDITIWYVDYLPGGLTAADYSDIPYADAGSFDWDKEPIRFSGDYLENAIGDRAEDGRKLQFGVAYEDWHTGGVPGIMEGRLYKPGDITLTVTYKD